MSQAPEEGFKVTDRRRCDEPAPRAHDAPRREDPGAQSAPAAGEKASLADLFMMLATEAVVALGDAPDPVTGQPARELTHAAEMIDLLVLLREKTQGNRTTVETQVLDDVLYDLQLRYVRATKSAG